MSFKRVGKIQYSPIYIYKTDLYGRFAARFTTPIIINVTKKLKMFKTLGDIGWVLRQDGERDQRYTMPQVLNLNGLEIDDLIYLINQCLDYLNH